MIKFFSLIQRVIGALACCCVLGGVALSQQVAVAPGPEVRDNPACWPAPCQSTEDPDAQHYFGTYLTPPRMAWYAEFDGAAIQAKPQSRVDVATLGTPANVVLTTGNFGYDLQGAGRVLVGCTLDECFQVEGLYTAITTSDNNASVRDASPNILGTTGNLMSPFGGFGASPITGLDYMNYASIHYTNSFQGGELNLRRQMPMAPGRLTMSILGGIRYNDISEDFEFDSTTASPAPLGGANNFHVHTDNQMIGGQIGALFEFYIENRWWVDCEMKGVIFSNRALMTTTYQNISNGVTSFYSNSDQETHTTFAEELSVTLVYRWSEHVATRLGYQAVFMQDVALAPDNLVADINVVKLGPAQVSHNQSIIYSGPVAGLMVAW